MNILSIETSCDETAVSIVVAGGEVDNLHFDVLGNSLFSQIKTHAKYGGVFPMMAKREHAQNFPHLLISALTQAKKYITSEKEIYSNEKWQEVEKILEREDGLHDGLRKVLENVVRPDVDMIAVTFGPGLEPALWVGISCAKALGILWDVPVIPTNHMEGHIFSVLLNRKNEIQNSQSSPEERPYNANFPRSHLWFQNQNSNTEKLNTINFPALALLISGGHTELVKISNWGQYTILGQTRDDAVGEAFDKVARMLGLPYPGGPQISRLAEKARTENLPKIAKLPRPMIHSDNYDFSFSGLKTAVLYYLRDHPETNESDHPDIAREFEDAVVEVLVSKTKKALLDVGADTLIIAGGVISNTKIRQEFQNLTKEIPQLNLEIPALELATDNAVMIALAGYINVTQNPESLKNKTIIKAEGNLKLGYLFAE